MISVIITTQNRINDLKRILPILNEVAIPGFEIIIVDNDSTDGTNEYILNYFPNIMLIKLYWNSGGVTGRNIAAKNANNKILVSLDDDAIITERTFNTILNIFIEEPDVGVIPGSVINGTLVEDRNKYEDSLKDDKNGKEVFAGTACGLAFRKEIFEKCGFWEDWGQESPFELSLIIKSLSIGLKIKRYNHVTVFHYHSHSTTRNSKKAHYSATMSWVWWYIKFYPVKSMIKNIVRIFYLSCFAVIDQKTPLYLSAIFSALAKSPTIYMDERTPYDSDLLNKIRTTDNFLGG
jgi:glycosyltransferase involved in cell wall biosynthesis